MRALALDLARDWDARRGDCGTRGRAQVAASNAKRTQWDGATGRKSEASATLPADKGLAALACLSSALRWSRLGARNGTRGACLRLHGKPSRPAPARQARRGARARDRRRRGARAHARTRARNAFYVSNIKHLAKVASDFALTYLSTILTH